MSNECTYSPKIKAMIFVKKGMAEKALINNMKTGNIKKIEKQVKKGTVMIEKYA